MSQPSRGSPLPRINSNSIQSKVNSQVSQTGSSGVSGFFSNCFSSISSWFQDDRAVTNNQSQQEKQKLIRITQSSQQTEHGINILHQNSNQNIKNYNSIPPRTVSSADLLPYGISSLPERDGASLSEAHGSLSMAFVALNKTVLFDTYIKHIPQNSSQYKNLLQISEATGAILDSDNNAIANAILVTRSTAIVPAHAFSNNNKIYFPSIKKSFNAEVIFDGSTTGLDFKWVYFSKPSIKPALLSASSDGGISLQLSYSKNLLTVTPFKSEASQYMAAANIGGNTYEGQSGGPRVSCNSEAVESILQGDGSGLKINDIYLCLESVFAQHKNSIIREEVENFKAQFIDPEMIYMHSNPNPIIIGAVGEEAQGLHRITVKNSGIFTSNFLDKHYARDLTSATKIAVNYSGKVTIIKITNQDNLDKIKIQADILNKKNKKIQVTTAWEFTNGVHKKTIQPANIIVGYNLNQISHVEGIS